MDVAETVSFILSTYDLTPKRTATLTRVAIRQVTARHLYTFDKQYVYISRLVERSQPRPREHFYGRFPEDLVTGNDSVHDEDNGSGNDHRRNGARDRRAVLRLLERTVDPPQYQFLTQLLASTNGNVQLRPQKVAPQLPRIRRRMQQVAAHYRVGTRVLFPLRPIKRVAFDPFEVSFRRRRLNGNPQEALARYQQVYGSISRTELFKVDQGLYQALRTAGQLEEAIPEPYVRRSSP